MYAESLVALVSADSVICLSNIYPFFYTNECHKENMQHYLCAEKSNALLPWSKMGWLLLSSGSVAETCLS